jgi:hypothetical protein
MKENQGRLSRRDLLLGTLSVALGPKLLVPKNVSASHYPDLENYLTNIEEEKQQILPKVEANELFAGFENSCNARRVEDFEMYFPIYKACELEFGVPWPLLWVIHVQETMVSTHRNPAASGYVGAMQRADWLWKDAELIESSQNWDMLKDLPQRYFRSRFISKNPYSVDYQEILWAAGFIRRQADLRYPELPHQDSFLKVVRQNYSAEVHGIKRVQKYQELAEILL